MALFPVSPSPAVYSCDNIYVVKNNPPPQRQQITSFHVLEFSFVGICGGFAGLKLAAYWGEAGWLVGVLVGVTCGFLLLRALWLLAGLYHRFRPLRPPCRQGPCHSDDYELRVVAKERSWEAENKCKWGDT